eukprot:2375917-Lingulodinium_polyedra.AAC.1
MPVQSCQSPRHWSSLLPMTRRQPLASKRRRKGWGHNEHPEALQAGNGYIHTHAHEHLDT